MLSIQNLTREQTHRITLECGSPSEPGRTQHLVGKEVHKTTFEMSK